MGFDKIFDLTAGVFFFILYTVYKMSFDKIFDLTAGVHFYSYNLM